MIDFTTADLVREALHPELQGKPEAADLVRRFARAVDAVDPVERRDAWVDLLLWSRIGRDPDRTATGTVVNTTRFRTLIGLVERSPALEVRFAASFAALLAATDGISLFAETGIPGDRGFLAEGSERLANAVLPEPHDPSNLAQIVRHLFPGRDSVNRLRGQGPGPIHRSAAILVSAMPASDWQPLRQAFVDAIRLLHVRILGQGLSPKLRARCRNTAIDASPFYRLHSAGEKLLAEADIVNAAAAVLNWRQAVAAVREEISEIHRQVEVEGVSVDIVYGVTVIHACLVRLETMVGIQVEPPGEKRSALIHGLLAELAEGCLQDRSLLHLASSNLRLLHRKIIERSGRTGEHYVAKSKSEYAAIWLAAAGGGLLTAFTAVFKTGIAVLAIAPFLIGLLSGINYAASFLALQHFHLVLATKQPAMTAATLAGIVRQKHGGERLDEIIDFTAAIVSSQIAAAVANILMVTLGACILDLLWTLATGHHWLSIEKAHHTYEQLSPISSLTAWYAVLTGVILWLSSLIGGWMDNWSTWHRLPQGLRDLGRGSSAPGAFNWLGNAVERHIAGWGTCISLGLMLGMAPVIGGFLGMPIDVRHVTLSTGTLALAAAGLEGDWFEGGPFAWAASGIAVMFVLNLGVSFSLSLFTALRAYGLPARDVTDLLRRLSIRVISRPLDFVLPPRGKTEPLPRTV